MDQNIDIIIGVLLFLLLALPSLIGGLYKRYEYYMLTHKEIRYTYAYLTEESDQRGISGPHNIDPMPHEYNNTYVYRVDGKDYTCYFSYKTVKPQVKRRVQLFYVVKRPAIHHVEGDPLEAWTADLLLLVGAVFLFVSLAVAFPS